MCKIRILIVAVFISTLTGCQDSGKASSPTQPDFSTGRAQSVLERLGVTQAQVYQVARLAARDSTVKVWERLRALGRESAASSLVSTSGRVVPSGRGGRPDPQFSEETCHDPGGGEGFCPWLGDDPNPAGRGFWAGGWSPIECFSPTYYGLDADSDGVTDACESDLAWLFAPELQYTTDCTYDSGNGRLGGDFTYAVRRKDSRTVVVAYLEALYSDCGSSAGLAAWYDEPHRGDSEFIGVELEYHWTDEADPDSTHWTVEWVFTSAHCGNITTNCYWWGHAAFEYDGVLQGQPKIWVAILKHANYASDDKCDDGAFNFDDCNATRAMDFPVTRGYFANIGSRGHPLIDCGEPLRTSDMVDPGVQECYWQSWSEFSGWQEAPPFKEAGVYSSELSRLGF